MKFDCKWCGESLDVGTEKKSVVAACLNGSMMFRDKNPVGRSIASCDVKLWGSPATRFEFGDPRDPSHILQTNP